MNKQLSLIRLWVLLKEHTHRPGEPQVGFLMWETSSLRREAAQLSPFDFYPDLRFPGGGHGNPLQYSGAWRDTVHRVSKSWTRLKPLSTLTLQLVGSHCWLGFPGGNSGKEPACQPVDTGDTGSIPGSGRSPGGEHGNPLQYSYLENPMDRVRHDWSYLAHMRCGAGEDSWESLGLSGDQNSQS